MEGVDHNKKKKKEEKKTEGKEGKGKVRKTKNGMGSPDIPLKFSDWTDSDIEKFGELMVQFLNDREKVCDVAANELKKEKTVVYEFYDAWVNSDMGSRLIDLWKKRVVIAIKEKESREKIGGWLHGFLRLPWESINIPYDMLSGNVYSLEEDRLLIYCLQMTRCDFDEVCRYIRHHYKLSHYLFLQSRTKEEIVSRCNYLLGILKKHFNKA